jgi:hypothetical protein
MEQHPTTIDGLKRAARKRRRATGLPYLAALDLVCADAGLVDYRNARRSLSPRLQQHGCSPAPIASFPVTIIQYWRERDPLRRGVERLEMNLPCRLSELVRPHHRVGYLSGVQLRGDEELIGYGLDDSQRRARSSVCQLARTLQFMAATGLRPTRSKRPYPKSDWYSRPPGADHDKTWYHPETGSYVLTDEPYAGEGRLEDPRLGLWRQTHGFSVVDAGWGSVYGFGTRLYLIGKAGGNVDLQAMASRLLASPARISERDWAGYGGEGASAT